MRPRREQTFKKKTVNLAKFCLKNAHPDQDKTETRLSKIEANETRLSQKFASETRPRQDKFQNFVRHVLQKKHENIPFCWRDIGGQHLRALINF